MIQFNEKFDGCINPQYIDRNIGMYFEFWRGGGNHSDLMIVGIIH